jgi:hypothetical protein
MGNRIASSLIQALRNSGEDTLLVSKTSSFPPIFINEYPGIAKAWVVFDGMRIGPGLCEILDSTNVLQVSSTSRRGEYIIVLDPAAKFDSLSLYRIEGSVHANSKHPLSGATGFFVKDTGYETPTTPPTPDRNRFYIQTYYSPMSITNAFSGGPSLAYRVSLNIYKN